MLGTGYLVLLPVLRYLRPAALILALALAIAGIQAGFGHLFEWEALGQDYKTYYGSKLLFAVILLVIVAFGFWERKYSGLHLMAIAGTALVLAGVQFVALATNSILCTTPT